MRDIIPFQTAKLLDILWNQFGIIGAALNWFK